MRAKRRDRGLGFEDSDTEDEDGDDADRRRRIAKKRKMEGGIEDSLDKLGMDSRLSYPKCKNADLWIFCSKTRRNLGLRSKLSGRFA